MKISIITPCYNAEPYIARTIQSVQNQTITDWEMIIIDDGSIDNSVEIVKDIACNDQRIKLFQKENGGSASARNMGLALAQGEFIQFLDADDTIEPTKIERQITLMEQELLDVTYSDYCMVTKMVLTKIKKDTLLIYSNY
jgi:glycosyltransferase involved in cell wall biosynthesis